MEITIDLETCKFIVCFRDWNSYSVFVSKLSGEAIQLPIPKLIQLLQEEAERRKNETQVPI